MIYLLIFIFAIFVIIFWSQTIHTTRKKHYTFIHALISSLFHNHDFFSPAIFIINFWLRIIRTTHRKFCPLFCSCCRVLWETFEMAQDITRRRNSPALICPTSTQFTCLSTVESIINQYIPYHKNDLVVVNIYKHKLYKLYVPFALIVTADSWNSTKLPNMRYFLLLWRFTY